MKEKIKALWVIVAIAVLAVFLVKGGKDFVLGLDLAGGSALTYKIDTSSLAEGASIDDSVSALRDVVERRVNLFGVREAGVQTSYSRIASEWRLIVELPGVTDIQAAAKLIGETPVLDFRVPKKGANLGTSTVDFIAAYEQTQLTGRYLSHAALVFDPTTSKPLVELTFDDEGAKLFASITKAHIGQQVAIVLDGEPISAPTVQQEITGGKAVISGNFSPEEAKTLVGRLNAGALPLPISLAGTSVVGPSLGAASVHSGVYAAIIGFLLVSIFMLVWYRLPGLVAIAALACYTVLNLVVFKEGMSPAMIIITAVCVALAMTVSRAFLVGVPIAYVILALIPGGLVPVTLTSAGIAGFIISVGLAVDANVLTFERMKEELRNGRSLKDAIDIGFARAWTSIRDSHIAAVIVSIVLYMFGTSLVKGFAITFFLGAILSLVSAQMITKVFLSALVPAKMGRFVRFLFGSGFSVK
ncbi:MAG: preprotein translocase subunit SecD [Candidatus Paceibacterota bacterium]